MHLFLIANETKVIMHSTWCKSYVLELGSWPNYLRSNTYDIALSLMHYRLIMKMFQGYLEFSLGLKVSFHFYIHPCMAPSSGESNIHWSNTMEEYSHEPVSLRGFWEKYECEL